MKRKPAIILLSIFTSLSLLVGCEKGTDLNNVSENTVSESIVSENNIDSISQDNASVVDETILIASPESYVAQTHDYIAKDSISIASVSHNTPQEPESSAVYIEPITNVPDDFIKGVDASEVLAIENSGAKYYDADGNEDDVFSILASEGVNYVRLRVWNNPYDLDGNGYGGGNCDIDTAIALGQRATAQSMGVMVDFEYSDFWADSDRQLSPVYWKNFSIDDKAAALYDFTYDSLEALITSGVNVTMVQIGNETNNGMSGETDVDVVALLQKSGSQAVRDISNVYACDIKVCLHYSNSTDYAKIDSICSSLEANEVDYDIMALSYYCYKAGSFDQFSEVATHIKKAYSKDVILAEFAYPYTSNDGDFYTNSTSGTELEPGYTSSVQSQATFIRDTCELAIDSNCLGVFYWGATWIPTIGGNLTNNQLLWETYGCGWATSYAADYDPDYVGNSYGGSMWDNQALFDASGKALASLDAFKYLSVGTICDPRIDYVPNVVVECTVGKDLELPETVPAIFNNRTLNSNVLVTWDEEDVANVDTSSDGEFIIDGMVMGLDGEEIPVTGMLTVGYVNLAQNASFEYGRYNMWDISYEGDTNPTDFQKNGADAYTGDVAFHYSSEEPMEFTISQTVRRLPDGVYMVSVYSQGGDVDETCEMTLFAISGDQEYTIDFMNTSWNDWQHPDIYGIPVTDGTITFGVRIKGCANCWGTLDDFALSQTE